MKRVFEAVVFNGVDGFDQVKTFKIEQDAVSFAEHHPEVTLRKHDKDGKVYTWNEQKERWEE